MSIERNKYIFILGPTAVGKTALLRELQDLPIEVINADSLQVYKGLDIGSAKPKKEELQLFRYHLLDICDPKEKFDVAKFINLAELSIAAIHERAKYPLFCGGTAFYIHSFLYGLPAIPKINPSIRSQLKLLSKESKWRLLEFFDPATAARISSNDSQRLARALEVFYSTGTKFSSFKSSPSLRPGIKSLLVCLERPKSEINARICARVNNMFENGLVDEVLELYKLGLSLEDQAIQGIGYREFFTINRAEVAGKNPQLIDQVREQIITNTKKYAKRQLTFFKKLKDLHYLQADCKDEFRRLVENFIRG